MMNINTKILLTILFWGIFELAKAQTNTIDSLIAVNKTLQEKEKAANFNKIAQLYLKTSNEKCLEYAEKAHQKAKEYNNKNEEGKALYFMGTAFLDAGNFLKSLTKYKQSIKIFEDLGESGLAARIYIDLGAVYKKWGKFDTAIVVYQKALKIQEDIKDIKGQANTLANIGNIYFFLKENTYLDKALENYNQALVLFKKEKNEWGQAMVLLNIGWIYQNREQYEKAEVFAKKTLKINKKNKYQQGMAFAYELLASLKKGTKEYAEAEKYYKKAINITEKADNAKQIPLLLKEMGDMYQMWGKKEKSLLYFEKAVQELKARGQIKETSDCYKEIANLYDDKKNYKEALFNFREHKKLEDSIYNKQMHKTISEMQTKYETEKKDLQIKNQKEEIKRQNFQRNFFIAGFIIVMLFSLALFRLFSEKKKANVKLADQNILLENQNLEIIQQRDKIFQQNQNITDSIQYASRIQNAILPQEEFIRREMPEHFILFKPRDIVSGDFYWIGVKEGKLVVVAADCTGHGVPGAFMSMLGVSFLNEIVNSETELKASNILDRLRDNIIHSLHQTGKEDEAKDGMDIALCIIDRKEMRLQFAGAYNPLYLIREGKIEQIKADRMPIGIYFVKQKPFKNNELEIKKDDVIYIFSDGFPDQFGGEQGKKFMSKNFKNHLLNIHDKPMKEQKEILDKEHIKWMGEKYEQTDDVLVIGLKI